jgi:hypothetical protein
VISEEQKAQPLWLGFLLAAGADLSIGALTN